MCRATNNHLAVLNLTVWKTLNTNNTTNSNKKKLRFKRFSSKQQVFKVKVYYG